MPSPLPFTLSEPSLFHNDFYVDSQWAPAKSGQRFDVVDPGTGNTWTTCADATAEDVGDAVQSSYAAFAEYRKTTPRQRAQWLMEWHRLLQASREDLAAIMVHETGKPMAEARAEIDYGCTFIWWFAGEAERAHGSTFRSAIAGRRTVTIKQPIGVVAALVPWNFPMALFVRKASGALAAGCTMVAKPSPETPVSALTVALLAVRAGFPRGVLNVLTTSLANTPAVAEALCLDARVKKVTFTGSTRVGKIVEQLCARQLKKTTLELGGNCPFIVFDDADLGQAIPQLMALKWRHAGQACITANRVFVQSGIHDRFVQAFCAETKKTLRMGHGSVADVNLGPVTTARSLDRAEAMYRDAVAKGAEAVLGNGTRAAAPAAAGAGQGGGGGGYFMEPTVLTKVTDDMALTQDEIFAPLLGVATFETEEEVTARANNTSMGLAAYVFTKDSDRLWRMLENIEAGMIGLNAGNSSAAEAPFGGIKESGHGKESGKDVAIDEYLITKTGTMAISGLQ
ncbi:Aldehyde/histidinol dehydrogenase [Niveomyces insectorum RCEF 264]|uniref:succinate-semialdehyde dehydrogenase [NAD(P)(+)] n=1 Tax=Niveomyces insectorum RCEF 264 TaxID=1081102 RepID=A0A167Q8J4_9HYPO|nr:Aldehyde/histidinol dehydrogenase [Niveomyces insectorum RCEF 264]